MTKDLAYLKLLAGQYPTEAKALAEMIACRACSACPRVPSCISDVWRG